MKKEIHGWLMYALAILLAVFAERESSGFEPLEGNVIGYCILSGALIISGTLALVRSSSDRGS